MIKIFKISILSFSLLFFCAISGCKKKEQQRSECPGFDLVPTSPYEDPVWHPSGNIIGFNHTPIKEIKYSYGYECPRQAQYIYETDSAGFWLINSDGTNKRRMLSYKLQNPAWSSDGKWIAFVQGAQIYKMPFDGEKFDESGKVQLTFSGRNFFPAWSPDGEWIAYQRTYSSPEPEKVQGIWYIKSTGENNTQIFSGNSGYPEWKSSSEILFIRGVNSSGEIIGDSILCASTIAKNILRMFFIKGENRHPKVISNNSILLISSKNDSGAQIYSLDESGNHVAKLTTTGVIGFSWSLSGKIVYVSFDETRIDKNVGVLWIMNSDGSNKQQLTFNQMKITQ